MYSLSFLAAVNAGYAVVPQVGTLAARDVWIIAVVLLAYLGVAMCVALFSKDAKRADRARAIFNDLVRLFWWRSK